MTGAFDNTLSSLGINRYGTSDGPVANAGSNASMGQEDFLTLMTAQLKNQDPFKPMDNNQMVAQMAQFSSLSGITEMNATLSSIAQKLGATSTSDVLSWVGSSVLTQNDIAYPRTDGTLGGSILLGEDATDVTVKIANADGEILKTVSLGPQEAGNLDFEWDGTTDNGDAPGSGPFTISVDALDANGNSVSAQTLVWSSVTSVSFDQNGDPILNLPGIGRVSPADVLKVG
ncbi:flagellar hook assembly protein FlgD [Stakelama tenebrarum]|uniref:Basal-body rod modification protein FlgD n=1 Tax=Stakelama tenebrarum TaxID=2711215 RepID=A0A6G6Y1M1_9SPHN|nr:flagellar hook assembly protein FlgD [Sphingosinithalassobacter tenebrarum]QIG78707.1 flagellar hook assembly protein FlgD [Sphingosinithalassobacter tenebrarum]